MWFLCTLRDLFFPKFVRVCVFFQHGEKWGEEERGRGEEEGMLRARKLCKVLTAKKNTNNYNKKKKIRRLSVAFQSRSFLVCYRPDGWVWCKCQPAMLRWRYSLRYLQFSLGRVCTGYWLFLYNQSRQWYFSYSTGNWSALGSWRERNLKNLDIQLPL